MEPHSWNDVAEFLTRGPSRYVAWNVKFDAQALLRWAPRRALDDLALHGRAAWGDFRVAYMPRKFLRVTVVSRKATATIRDAAVWYASSLDTAARGWLGKSKVAVPHAWMEDFRRPLNCPRTRRAAIVYCIQDARLAGRLWARVARGFDTLGVKIVGVSSPAGAAARLWKNALRPGVSRVAQDHFQRAFYGGRFETTVLGRVRDAVAWDIRSAYPWAFAALRSIRDADEFDVQTPAEIWNAVEAGHYVAARARVTIPSTLTLGPLPYRLASGLVVFPVGRIAGTWTGPDLLAARDAGARFEFEGAHVLAPMYDEPAFPAIRALYDQRRDAETRGDKDLSLAIKLTLNGLYGKTAEQRSVYRECTREALRPGALPAAGIVAAPDGLYAARRWPGKTAAFPYAAEATARVRARLLADLEPRDVLFLATDGALLRQGARPPKVTGDALGAWKHVADGLTGWIVGNGFYFLRSRKAGVELDRARGYGRLALDDFADLLSAAPRDARTLILPRTLRSESLSARLRGGSVEDMNDLVFEERTLELDSDDKRYWTRDRTAGALRRGAVTSKPWTWIADAVDPRSLIRTPKRRRRAT